MPSLLLEIGCEELPASAARGAERQLPDLVERALGTRPHAVYAGPRRLAVLVRDLDERTADEWIKGPPLALREKAAAGFARRHGVAVDELEERDGFLGVVRPGRPMTEVLPERLDALVRGIPFRKTMRWDDSGLRFPRPVRWILAKLDAQTVPGYAGTSWGHRFTHGEIDVPTAEAYAETLRSVDVEPDSGERRRLIVEGLDGLGAWSDPGRKLEEVVHLVERATVVEGSFAARFLELPERVVVTTMQSHQRYFPLGGSRFAVVLNGGDPEVARAGHEQVLEARLEDAAFTFERDVRRGIDGLAGELGSITFAAGAGTFADKTERLVQLVEALGGDAAAREAALLAKADQAAELVREFPDLEGYIGAQYARLAGYPEAVSTAIEEHYLPDGADAPLPRTEAGRVVSAADKLDNIAVNFRLGNKPTGSRDPFGLRRAAIGLCRLAVEGGLTIERCLLEDEARDFVQERLEGLLDVPVEYLRAARASMSNDLGGVARTAQALYDARDTPEFDGVFTAYDRAHRLAGKAEGEAAAELDRALLEDPAERSLAETLAEVVIDGDVPSSLASAAALAPVMERFFEDVLVMAEDPRVRANRLRLLLDVRDTLGRLGDFSQIPR